MLPEKFRYIVVEGPIGVGKTSLAQRLGERFNARLLLEDPAANPFLPKFYRDMRRHALATQLFFLFQRIQQVSDLKQQELFDNVTVADFLLAKDPLFARLTLSDDEFRLYQRIYEHVRFSAPAPDLVIYLQAPTELLMERVQRRGWKAERGITEEYLRKLNESYTEFFYQYEGTPLLIVNSENLNFVDRTRDFELLVEQIGQVRGPREYFNRAA